MVDHSNEGRELGQDFSPGAERLERFVLDTARDDAPSAEAKARLLASTDALLSQASEPSGDVWAVKHIVSAVGAAVLAGAVIVGVVTPSRSSAPAPSPATTALPSEAPAAPLPVHEEAPAPTATPPAQAPESLPDAPARAPRASTERASTRPAASAPAVLQDGSSLEREIARIRTVREQIAAGRADRALAELDAYGAEFPSGAFALEVVVLRVEALLRAGRTDEARRLGERFLSQHPSGASARRVKVMLERSAPANDARARSE